MAPDVFGSSESAISPDVTIKFKRAESSSTSENRQAKLLHKYYTNKF